MMFELWMARRYLSMRRKPLFVSFLTQVCFFAVAAAAFALTFVMAVLNGFERDFHQRVLRFRAPLIARSATREPSEVLSSSLEFWRKKDARIREVVPFIEGEAVAQNEFGRTVGVRVRGVEKLPAEDRLGRYESEEDFTGKNLVMGDELAASLQVHPVFSEEVRLVFPLGDVGPTGDLLPRSAGFRVTGLFHSGYYDFDSRYVLVSYDQALNLFGPEARRYLEIWVEPPVMAEEVKQKLVTLFPPAEKISFQTWKAENPKLFAAMKLEKIGMFLLLGMLLLIASATIFGLTSLIVTAKKKDMAVLRSLGLSKKKLRRIFLFKSLSLGLGGTALGCGLGLLVILGLRVFPIRLPTSYYLEFLPVSLDFSQVIAFFVLAPAVTLAASLYPSYQASRFSPVEALRYE